MSKEPNFTDSHERQIRGSWISEFPFPGKENSWQPA